MMFLELLIPALPFVSVLMSRHGVKDKRLEARERGDQFAKLGQRCGCEIDELQADNGVRREMVGEVELRVGDQAGKVS